MNSFTDARDSFNGGDELGELDFRKVLLLVLYRSKVTLLYMFNHLFQSVMEDAFAKCRKGHEYCTLSVNGKDLRTYRKSKYLMPHTYNVSGWGHKTEFKV